MIGLLLLGAAPALAWETDQLSRRLEPLPDITAQADARLQEAIDAAILATNERTRCEGPDDQLHRVLAEEIHQRVGRPVRVPGRGWLRGRGYNEYGAWVEELPQADWLPHGEHIYSEVALLKAPVLRTAGVCSSVGLAGQRVGVDKLDHFLGMGHAYWERSGHGAAPEAAIAWGTLTERSFYGMSTSLAFSYADLEANLDGYRFYAGLLGPQGVAGRGDDGCLVATRPFSWADWIDWRYDEVYNPPVYTRTAARAVEQHLAEEREAICASYAAWGGPEYQARLQAVLDAPTEAVLGKAPERLDPYQLDELCAQATVRAAP